MPKHVWRLGHIVKILALGSRAEILMFFRLQVLKPGMMHRRQSNDAPALAAVLDAVRRTEDSPADDSDDPIEQPDKNKKSLPRMKAAFRPLKEVGAFACKALAVMGGEDGDRWARRGSPWRQPADAMETDGSHPQKARTLLVDERSVRT